MERNTAQLTPQTMAFEDLNLQVGMRLQLLTHRSVKPVVHMSALIGYVKDEYMIVRLPTGAAIPINLNVGERITLRTFSGTNVGSFASTVERVFEWPRAYAHIAFPDVINGTSLRTATRVRADIPVLMRGESQPENPIVATLDDVSVSGARIKSSQPLAEGEKIVELEFALPLPPSRAPAPVHTMASIKNLTVADATEDTLPFHYGVQFVGLEPLHYLLLQNMTYEAMLTQRNRIV